MGRKKIIKKEPIKFWIVKAQGIIIDRVIELSEAEVEYLIKRQMNAKIIELKQPLLED